MFVKCAISSRDNFDYLVFAGDYAEFSVDAKALLEHY
jgi:hypothetical protein